MPNSPSTPAAHVLVFPGEEDVGIAPAEVRSAGVPVVAYAVGGARDDLAPGVNDMLAENQGAAAFAQAMGERRNLDWCEDTVRESSQRFAADVWHREPQVTKRCGAVDVSSRSMSRPPG